MAHIKSIERAGQTVVEFHIDHSVGVKGRNLKDDVQLIQFMLNLCNLTPISAFHQALTIPLPIDGICGTATKNAILEFQKRENKKKGFAFLEEDGTVNATSKAITPHHKGATLFVMNSNIRFGARLWAKMTYRNVGEPLLSAVLLPLQAAGLFK